MMGQLSQSVIVLLCISARDNDKALHVDELFLSKNSHQKPRKRMSGFLNTRNGKASNNACFVHFVNRISLNVQLQPNTGNTHRLSEK